MKIKWIYMLYLALAFVLGFMVAWCTGLFLTPAVAIRLPGGSLGLGFGLGLTSSRKIESPVWQTVYVVFSVIAAILGWVVYCQVFGA